MLFSRSVLSVFWAASSFICRSITSCARLLRFTLIVSTSFMSLFLTALLFELVLTRPTPHGVSTLTRELLSRVDTSALRSWLTVLSISSSFFWASSSSSSSSDDDGDSYEESGSSSSSTTGGTYTYGGTGTGTSATTLASLDLTGLTTDDLRAGTGRSRTVARGGAGAGAAGGAATQGVLGVKAEAQTSTGNKTDGDTSDTSGGNGSNNGSNNGSGNQQAVKVENPITPLADKPIEEGPNMSLLWLLGAGAAAGAGAYGYDKHKKKVAANNESKKYKK